LTGSDDAPSQRARPHLAPLYEAGEYVEVADRLTALVAAAPQYPMLFYNLDCCESLCGRTSDALDHLRHAVEMSEEFRGSAKDDSDLDPIRQEPAFERLISDEPHGPSPARMRVGPRRSDELGAPALGDAVVGRGGLSRGGALENDSGDDQPGFRLRRDSSRTPIRIRPAGVLRLGDDRSGPGAPLRVRSAGC
jgi:hypothetical protein